MTRFHDPRAQEQGHVDVNRFVIQKASRASRQSLCAEGRGRDWITDEEDKALVGCMRATSASKLLNIQERGSLVRGKMHSDSGEQGQ